MSTTTRLGVMAEVGRLADQLGAEFQNVGSDADLANAVAHAQACAASKQMSHRRRECLMRAAAWALLALEAHDTEASAACNPGPEGA